jgi:ERCC4-type nuclease
VNHASPVLIDRRVGSKELAVPLMQMEVPFEITTLSFGDVALMGNGPDGPTPIGVERKTVRDLANSLLSGRLVGHQLPGLVANFTHAWLVVEGTWREGEDGLVELPNGRGWHTMTPTMLARNLQTWLLTIEMRGGLKIRQTYDVVETARFVASLHQWWTGKAWDEHKSHLALYQAPDQSLFVKPSLVRRIAAELPGIGFDKSKAVERYFPTAFELIAADEKEWQNIDGIGKTLAKKIVGALHRSEK